MIRLYGHQKGESSFAQVTRGMRAAAKSAGLLAGEVALDLPNEERVEPGADAAVALHCGAPLGVRIGHTTGMHRAHWLLLAPNSQGIPPSLRMNLGGTMRLITEVGIRDRPLVSGFLAPSHWAADVLRDQFPEHAVRVAQHGVSDVLYRERVEYAARITEYRRGEFGVIHFTSSLGQRKGTRELIAAWQGLVTDGRLPRGARLVIVSNPLSVNEYLWEARCGQDARVADSISVVANPQASPATLAAALRRAHLVCQPSRAEGFGLVPLEARACGVPVAMTTCTGHADHWSPVGAVAIEHGALAPVDDYPGAVAPSVAVDAVRAGLEEAYTRWLVIAKEATDAADGVREKWSWESRNTGVLRDLVDEAG